MKIKVCGITEAPALEALAGMGADYAGLIFYPRSPRFMGEKLDGPTVKQTAPALSKVGVFVNAPAEEVMERVTAYGLKLVQLHGDESPEYCATLRQYVPVIKAFRIGNTVSWETMAAYVAVVDYFLFDTASKSAYGGTGHQFDWSVLDSYPFDLPFFLSGGIGLSEVAALQALRWPHLFAVDVNSRFESAPGIKNMKEVQAFIEALPSIKNS